MLVAAIGHLFSFPYKEYAGANISGPNGFMRSLGHALKLNDFYHDTVHQFAPTYHEYVLYNHHEGEDGTKKYRSRTFVPTGQEMDNARNNRSIMGNNLEEVQLFAATSLPNNQSIVSDFTIPASMQSSRLVDTSTPVAQHYDSSLVDLD